MRVLQVIAEMGSGGAEAVVEELAAGLPRHGHEVRVASAGGRRVAALETGGTVHAQVPLASRSSAGLLRVAAALHRVGRDWRPDVVHAHNIGSTLSAHLGVRHLRRRPALVTTFHGVAAADYARAATVLDRCADEVVVVAGEIGERLVAAGLRRVPVRTVVNAVTPPAAVPRADARQALGLAQDVPVVLCAARLVAQKRHDVLLDAWAQLPGDAVLLLAGIGDLEPDVRARAALLGDRVRVLGERDDVPALMAAADAFVLSSDWEGLPMALLEALASGLPVVATDVDGVAAAVGPEAALLVPPGQPPALAAALSAVLQDPGRRHAMGDAARRRADERFSATAMVQAYDQAYADALAGGRRRPPGAA